MSTPARLPLAAAAALVATALLLSSHTAQATGGVLPPGGAAEPSTLDLEVAIASAPGSTTRWSRLTVGGAFTVLWLVPVRPGARVDWAHDAWLDALTAATSPRILPPSGGPGSCMLYPRTAQETARWGDRGVTVKPRALSYQASANALRDHALGRGFAISDAVDARIGLLYEQGFGVVALEVAAGQDTVSTPTLRVTDDGPAIAPFALTGSTGSSVRLTTMVIGAGAATLGRETQPAPTQWNVNGSDYESRRLAALAASPSLAWIRESASHDVLFDGLTVPGGNAIPPVTAQYFEAVAGSAQGLCVQSAAIAGLSNRSVGRVCPAGALLKVPGGQDCQPTVGSLDPDALTCGSADDLALALSGLAPSSVAITRFVGFVGQSRYGADHAVGAGGELVSPVQQASAYGPCSDAPLPSPTTPSGPSTARPQHYERVDGSCSGSTTNVVYEDTGEEEVVEDDSCGGDSSSTSSSSSSSDDEGSDDSSGWDTSDDDSSDDEGSDDSSGWDTSDDDSSSNDSCSGSDSTSDSSDDSCSSSSSSSSNDGCSSKTEATAKNKAAIHAPHGKRKHKGSSPMSRYALLFVALLLPLRRGLRVKKL